MHARRPLSLRRLISAALVTLVVGGAVVALAACGDGATPAAPTRTLTPSTDESPGKKHSSASPSASTTVSPTATPTTPAPSPTPTRVGDKTIKSAILARIAQEPGLQGFDIRVVVIDRTVYLRGRVRTKAQRTLIEQIALTERGVEKVVSAIDVDDAAGY